MQGNGSTLENTLGSSGLHGGSAALMNKSYERILAETLEAQNMSANYMSNHQYYQMGANTGTHG